MSSCPSHFALVAIENLADLNRFNLDVEPAAEEKKIPVAIDAVRFANPPGALYNQTIWRRLRSQNS